MRVSLLDPSTVPAPGGGYSHACRLELGDGALLIVSGQLALAEDGRLVGAESMRTQTERVFELLAAILASQGASFADTINIRTYLTDMTRSAEYAAVRRAHLGDHLPTSTTVEVTRLVIPEALVEVDLTAAVRSP